MKTTFVGLLVLLFVCASRGQLVNGSLEDTQGTFVPYNGYMEVYGGSTTIPGWTVVHDSISWLPNLNPWNLTTPYGNMFLDLTGNHDNGSFGGISQTLTTVPSQTYRVVAVAGFATRSIGISRPNVRSGHCRCIVPILYVHSLGIREPMGPLQLQFHRHFQFNVADPNRNRIRRRQLSRAG